MIVRSTIHGVPEAPHLQDRDLEAFRAQRLIIESIAVAGSSVVQICIKVKSLAITTSCEETKTRVRVTLHLLAWETATQEKKNTKKERKKKLLFSWEQLEAPSDVCLLCSGVTRYDQMHRF